MSPVRTLFPAPAALAAGHGDPVKLAETLHTAFAQSKAPMTAPSPPSAQPAPVDLNTASLDKTLGFKGTVNGGVYQFSVPRGETISEGGMSVPPSMGQLMMRKSLPKVCARRWTS
jgi:hypothetical protein